MSEKELQKERPGKGRVWRLLLVLAALVLAFGLGYRLAGPGAAPPAPAESEPARAAETWTCSMHPQIRLPKPGKCPICFMDLIPVEEGHEHGGRESGGDGPSITLTPQAVKLAEVRTVPVARRPISRETRMTGSVDYDERRLAAITAWAPGRIDRLFVDYVGAKVKKGQPLALLYSPELVTAQAELLQASRALKDARSTGLSYLKDAAAGTLASAREKLRLLGLGSDQVDKILAGGEPLTHISIRSPIGGTVIDRKAVEGMYVKTGEALFTVADLSRVWVVLAAYESDLRWVAPGRTVLFTAEALPGRDFSGTVVYVDPMVDPMTRTVRVRLDADNREGLLKPGMFVRANMASAAPGTGEEPPLVIPDTAPLLTGERAVVYVETGPGTYEGREVVLGPRAESSYIVESGISEGEKVVVRGAFKIDSAMQILARPSMMNPEEIGSAEGSEAKEAEEAAPLSAPAAFRESLGRVYLAYRPLAEALSGDDAEKAREAAEEVSRALSETDMGFLSGEAHTEWMKDLKLMNEGLGRMKQAADIQGLRDGFLPLSKGLIAAMESLGHLGSGTAYEAFCPMAFDNKGGSWLSHDQNVRNPYYGAAMYGCGEIKRSIPARDGSRP